MAMSGSSSRFVVGLSRVWLGLGLVVSLTVALLMGLASPAGAVAGYGDVGEGTWYTDAVQWSTDNGIADIVGFCFGPDAAVSRGETAVWIYNMENQPDAGDHHSFSDVTDASQDDAISWMANTGITTGTSATTFAPDETLTRAQAATFLHRLADKPPAPPHSFGDVVAGWQQDGVSWMAHTGITTGTSPTTFAPEDTLTRAHLVTFLYRYKNEPDVSINTSTPNCDNSSSTENGSVDPAEPDEPSDVLEGQQAGNATKPIDGDWTIPTYICAAEGKYTTGDLSSVVDQLNDDLDGFFERLSSGRMTLRFSPGGVLSDDIDWEKEETSSVITLVRTGVFPCREEATSRSGTSQVLIFADVGRGVHGIAYLRTGPAWVAPTPATWEVRRTNGLDSKALNGVVVHELAHSVLGLPHLKGGIGHGSIFLDEWALQYTPIRSPSLACYQYEQLGWPVPDDAQPCSRLSPSRPESVSYNQNDDGSTAVTWEPPLFSDDAPITGYVLRLYTGTGYRDGDTPYAEFQKPADARSHTIDESIAPGTYLARVSARSKYGEGDSDSVVVDWAPLPPSFGPIRVRDVTHDTIHLVVDAEDHRDFQDETNENLIYEVQYTGGGQTDHKDVWGGSGGSVWFSLTDLESDTEYTIRVRACTNPYSLRRCTSWISTEASTSAAAALRPPAPISATAGSDWYLLTWDPVPGAESYQIELPSAGSQLRIQAPDFAQGYGLEPDTSYSARVRSCSSPTFSCEDEEWTTVTFTTAAEPTVPPPYRVALREVGDSWVTLMWEALGNRRWLYRVEYEYIDGTTSSGLLRRQRHGEIPLQLTVEPNRTYTFKIRNCELAEPSSACSTWTSFAFSTFPATSSVDPPSVQVADLADVWLGFSWEHVTGAFSYDWRYNKVGDNSWRQWGNESEPSIELRSRIAPDTEYSVEVRSCGEPTRPCSSWATTTVTTARSLPPAPPSHPVSLGDVTDTRIQLEWNQPQPGQYYEYRWYATNERGRSYISGSSAFSDTAISELEPSTAYTIAVRTCRWSAGIVCDNWVTLNTTTRQHP